ncbi:MAG: hypothetical protein AAGF66_07275 [Cyanobacteria bacterium P01_H01_bin.119]
MTASQGYILLLNQQYNDIKVVQSVLERLRCTVFVAESMEQAISRAGEDTPYLIILAGNHPGWAETSVHCLRQAIQKVGVTIVALTDSHSPSWLHEEDYSGIDGFLVKPLSGEILSTLVQSAWAKQACA